MLRAREGEINASRWSENLKYFVSFVRMKLRNDCEFIEHMDGRDPKRFLAIDDIYIVFVIVIV